MAIATRIRALFANFRGALGNWSNEPCDQNNSMIRNAHAAPSRNIAWQLEMEKNEEGKVVSATFKRTPRKTRGGQTEMFKVNLPAKKIDMSWCKPKS